MNKENLLKLIAESGYNLGYGAKKHFATFDLIEKLPGWLGFLAFAVGITVQNSQPMFQSQPELDEYQRLMQALTEAVATETAVTQKVTAQAQKSKQYIAEQLK